MLSENRKQKAEDRIVVAAAPRHLYDHAALQHTKHQSSVLIPPSSERGSSLIISLIILIVLMLLGVASITTSDTQFKLAGNLQFEDIAINNAEIAISAAETWLKTGANFSHAAFTTRNAAAAPELYPIDVLKNLAAPANDPVTMVWDNTNSAQVSAGNPNQRYLIEQMGFNQTLIGSSVVLGNGSAGCTKVNTYRITARGVGQRGATKFVQSFYSVLLNNSNPAVSC